jgi:hypothetical protein
MFILRVLRHPALLICLFGHAVLVSAWALSCWAAVDTRSTIVWFGALMLSLFLLLGDLPVFLIACWVTSWRLFDIFDVHDSFFWFYVRILAFGSIQWGIIGLLLAIPDLRDRPKL